MNMIRYAQLFTTAACFGGVSTVAPTLQAQVQPSTIMELGGTRLAVTREELRALSTLGNVVRSGQKGLQDRALADARRVARGRDARHVLALYELELGRRRSDDAMQTQALDALIQGRLSAPDKLPGYAAARGQIAYRAGDFAMAERAWSRWTQVAPRDPDAFANLAQALLAQEDASGALHALSRAIAIGEESGRADWENWYRQRLSIAQQAQQVEPGIAAARALVVAFPSPSNWRDALVVYRGLTTPKGAMEIELLRLMRYSRMLAQPAEYQRMAQLLRLADASTEAKSTLDEGVARGLLDPQSSPTREIIAEVDRSVFASRTGTATPLKSPELAGTQLQLGVSQVIAGKATEAETTFRSAAADAASGRYADIAFFWQTWLAQRKE